MKEGRQPQLENGHSRLKTAHTKGLWWRSLTGHEHGEPCLLISSSLCSEEEEVKRGFTGYSTEDNKKYFNRGYQ